jgi:hypothetical protein
MSEMGVNPGTVSVAVTGESAVRLLKFLLKSGWRMVPVSGHEYRTSQVFEFVNEGGMYSPHRLILSDRGVWHMDALVGQ